MVLDLNIYIHTSISLAYLFTLSTAYSHTQTKCRLAKLTGNNTTQQILSTNQGDQIRSIWILALQTSISSIVQNHDLISLIFLIYL